jgi:hypothetical protein
VSKPLSDTGTMQALADRLGDDCFEAHRGAFWWDEGSRVAVAFGNDGYATEDNRAALEVAELRDMVAAAGGEEVGFATTADGYTWALACRLPAALTPEALEAAAWAAYGGADADHPAGACFQGWQLNTARAVLERNGLL